MPSNVGEAPDTCRVAHGPRAGSPLRPRRLRHCHPRDTVGEIPDLAGAGLTRCGRLRPAAHASTSVGAVRPSRSPARRRGLRPRGRSPPMVAS